MSRTAAAWAAVPAALCGLSAPASAESVDTLYLVDGTSVSGKILFQHDGVYALSNGRGVERIPVSRIARIRFADKASA